MSHEVVLTGIGVLSPFGIGASTLYERLLAGDCGVTPLEPPFQHLKPGFGGQVSATWKELKDLPGAKGLRPSTMTRYSYLASGAVAQTLQDADIDPEDGRGPERGLMIGSLCNMDNMDKYVRFPAFLLSDDDLAAGNYTIDDSRLADAMKLFTGFEILRLMNNMPTAHGGIEAGAQGPCNTFLGSVNSGLQAIGEAYFAIQDGLATQMIAGGVGSSSHELLLMTKGYRGQLCTSDSAPDAAGRPFDQNATGQVPGEAGVFFLLEREDVAKARGATIWGRIAGYGHRFTAPDSVHGAAAEDACIGAANEAMEMAGWKADQIDLVLPSAIGRRAADEVESRALSAVLDGARPPWYAPTAQLGFAESAALPLSLAVALMSCRHGKLPANRNLTAPIDGFVLPSRNEATECTARKLWVHGYAPNGIGASLLVDASPRPA